MLHEEIQLTCYQAPGDPGKHTEAMALCGGSEINRQKQASIFAKGNAVTVL